MCQSLSLHLSVDIYITWFRFLAVMNGEAISTTIEVQFPLWCADLKSSGFIPKNGIARSHGLVSLSFGYTFTPPPIMNKGSSVPPFTSSPFLGSVHSDWTEMKYQKSFSVSLVAMGVEHCFKYLLAVCIFPFENCLSSPVVHLLTEWLFLIHYILETLCLVLS